MVDAQTANVTDKQQLINKVSKTDMQIQCSFKAQKLDPRLTKHQKHGQKIGKKKRQRAKPRQTSTKH